MSTNTSPVSESAFHKELDLIQDVIKRMAQNSFQVKAWLIGILSALVVLESKSIFAQANGDKVFSMQMNLFLLLPILCFWYLDAFFLSTEKLYRELYKWVVQNRPYTSEYLYDLNTFKRNNHDGGTSQLFRKENNWLKMAFSKTLLPFYAVPSIIVLGVMFYNLFR